MDERTISLLEDSFGALAPSLDQVVADFYDELFRVAPGVRGLFGDDVGPQRMHLAQALSYTVSNLRKTEALLPALQQMGARHVGYGAQPEHYPVVRDALLTVMERHAGAIWTAELGEAWTAALNLVAEVMLSASEPATEHPQPTA